jgi:LPS-assembly lipoprotein
MSWSKALRRSVLTLAAVLALGPAGCGFHPLYSKGGGGGGVSAETAQIRINLIADRQGQMLRNALLQRLTPAGEPASPTYTLSVTLTASEGALGYRKDTFATLGNLSMAAQVALASERGSLMSSGISTTVSFDYLGPRYASIAMERDAEDRAVTQLADLISNRVAATLAAYKAGTLKPIVTRDPVDSGTVR